MSINDGFKTATLRQGGVTDKYASRSSTDGRSALKIFQIQSPPKCFHFAKISKMLIEILTIT